MKRLSLSILLLAVVTCAYGEATPTAQPAAALDSFNILVSNDDGYDAPGIRALVEGLRSLGRVAVAAPAVEQSGKGHGLTLREPISVFERKQPDGEVWYAIDGPPATCVRLTRLSIKPRHDTFERRTSPRGQLYFWADWRQLEDDEEGTDVWAFVRGYITVTPMALDVTGYRQMESLRMIESNFPAGQK